TVTRTTNFAADMRRRLTAGGWAGWPAANPADPWIMRSEGGVPIRSIRGAARWNSADPAAQRAKQAELVQRAWDRMASEGEGAGGAFAAHQLWEPGPNFHHDPLGTP